MNDALHITGSDTVLGKMGLSVDGSAARNTRKHHAMYRLSGDTRGCVQYSTCESLPCMAAACGSIHMIYAYNIHIHYIKVNPIGLL